MNRKTALHAIDREGILLVFPIDNRKEPASLWSVFYKDPMRWEWDESGDNRVADLWHLRAELSESRKAIYTKWYQGRATYFSIPVFEAMLKLLNPDSDPTAGLSPAARKVLSILEAESPLSTKELKRQADMKGRANEAAYEKALKELWSRLLIVAYGEVDDGAFPSLAVGATRSLFEESYRAAFNLSRKDAEARVAARLREGNLFLKHFRKLASRVQDLAPAASAGKAARATARRRISSVVRFEDL